ncbi:histone-like nucleoid-structuring protein Lsr2 [Streptomyces sp. NBRC 110035]|uniref:WhiB family transcriptional regulator n=1 Tax=Streptomyces sp. NBRC 110035 TaxID=1547867 RepID=UPI0006964B84|nr:histone-like nucleoid-structuring protein Lsr2 [Streptomyces sp. NBRC 110035]
MTTDAWRERAACAGHDLDTWFNAAKASTAKQTCDRCPVRAECLHDALVTEPAVDRYGTYGGLTGPQRRRLPTLPEPRTAALHMLRDLLAEHDAQQPDEGTVTMPDQTAPEATDNIPIGRLLKWGEDHPDTDVQDQAARIRAGLLGLRRRYAADQELTAIATEREQLEKRLAELGSREAELAPAKAKRKRATPVRDYDTRTVRAWAAENGVDCPAVGQIPKRVLDAWRASLPQPA